MRKYLTTEYILRHLHTLGMTSFSVDEFSRVLLLPPARAHRVLSHLAGTGVVRRLGRGHYVLVGHGGTAAASQPFFLATRLVEPSYVSFWSALHFYGWTDQPPRTILVANTKRSSRGRLGPYSYRLVRLPSHRFFGYTLARQADVEFPMAEPEKAVVDAVYLPQLAGGMDAVAEALGEAFPSLDRERLESDAAQMGVRSLCSRIGYLLRVNGVDSRVLRPRASSTFVKLDPAGPRRGRYDAAWRIIDNMGGGS